MKKFLVRNINVAATICLLLATCSFAAFGGAGADSSAGNYGSFQKYISLQSGTTASAWTDRGNICVSSAMVACGDGTYYIKQNLFPGAVYNFIFFGVTGATPATGLTAYTSYYDCPRDSGDDAGFFVAVDSNNATGTKRAGAAYFSGQINGESRRWITVPQDTGYSVSSTSGIWVYNNWSSTGVPSISATPTGSTSINVVLGAYSTWGTGNEAYKSIDIYGGGKWYLYRSTSLAGTEGYLLIASSTSAQLGASMTYSDATGLAAGNTYYYIAITSDAYKGALNALAADACLARQLSDGTINPAGKTPTAVSYDGYARPAAAIPVYFKVEAPNWDYINEHDNVVYLTPVGIDGRVWPYKIPGKICRVYLPKT